jgi:predicted AAA+ superfamily ATPase
VSDFVAAGDVSAGFVQALWDVIAGDAFQSTGMTDADVATFLERLVIGIGSPLNASAVARDVGLSDNHRVNDRIGALGFALMSWRCHRTKSGLPNLRAQEKVYFLDPLIARLPHLRDERRRDPDDSQLTEQQLGMLLLRAAGDGGPEALLEANTVMYERTSSDAEIDFVGPELEVAFEGKYVDGPWRRAAQSLRARREHGVMVTRTVLDLDEREGATRVWAVPAGIVGWLLRSSASL